MHQLLRTLNLNSPGPFSPTVQTKDLGPPSISPDVSPVSTTSALLTPPDLSPAKAYGEWKFNPSFDFGPAAQAQMNNALLFETDPQHRYQDVLGGGQPASFRPAVVQTGDSFRPNDRAFASFEPFTEPSQFSVGDNYSRLESEPAPRHDPGLLHPSWAHQRLRTSSTEWAKVDDRRTFENILDSDPIPGSSPHGQRSHANANEVSICVDHRVQKLNLSL